jgi:hypothetical protein
MKIPLDLLPMALCGLATLVAVAVILVASDLLRRLVLRSIAAVERTRRAAPAAGDGHAAGDSQPPGEDRGVEETVSRSETLTG